MEVQRITDGEGELLNVLQDVSPLAWRRYQARRLRVWKEGRFVDEDGSIYPPFVCFRFIEEDVLLIGELRRVIESYVGTVKWAIKARQREYLPGTNWMVAPALLMEIRDAALAEGVSPSQYLAERDPVFGPGAHDDFLRLTHYIKHELAGLFHRDDR